MYYMRLCMIFPLGRASFPEPLSRLVTVYAEVKVSSRESGDSQTIDLLTSSSDRDSAFKCPSSRVLST